jgi:hypothetical protein
MNLDWMVVEPSMEEELQLEQTVREIRQCNSAPALATLCVALTRQQWHQSKLLKQAVCHIASLDAVITAKNK